MPAGATVKDFFERLCTDAALYVFVSLFEGVVRSSCCLHLVYCSECFSLLLRSVSAYRGWRVLCGAGGVDLIRPRSACFNTSDQCLSWGSYLFSCANRSRFKNPGLSVPGKVMYMPKPASLERYDEAPLSSFTLCSLRSLYALFVHSMLSVRFAFSLSTSPLPPSTSPS
jgi:hypothetical protein